MTAVSSSPSRMSKRLHARSVPQDQLFSSCCRTLLGGTNCHETEEPEEAIDKKVTKGQTFGSVESVKAVSDLYAPVSGTVTEVNGDLATAPEQINKDAHSAWMIKITLKDAADLNALLSAADYEKFVAEEGGH